MTKIARFEVVIVAHVDDGPSVHSVVEEDVEVESLVLGVELRDVAYGEGDPISEYPQSLIHPVNALIQDRTAN